VNARALFAPALALASLLALPGPARAQVDTGTWVVRDFRFRSGETLAELKLHYMTMGRPRRDAAGVVRNAVLVMHGTTGSGRQFLNPLFTELYGAGEALDTATHYLIFPDGIGHGASSRPSDGLHARFPHYTYDDMVAADYRLLTERLGVNHLLLVMGTSMGGMHTWVWGETHPDFMDGLVPLASLPTAIAGRNRMMRKMILDDIRDDPAWQGGDYAAQPPGLRAALQLLWVMTSAPLVQQRQAPTRDSADAVIGRWLAGAARGYDANDVLYAFDASREYDPSVALASVTPGAGGAKRDSETIAASSGALERIKAPLLAINSADDFINPPELGIMDSLIRRVPRGRYVLIPIGPLTRGHGTHTVAAAWKAYFAPFVAELERRRRP
jgi:homoserine O-acetyltransferase